MRDEDHPATSTVLWAGKPPYEMAVYRGHDLVVHHLTDRWHIGYIDGRHAGVALGPMSKICNLLFREVDRDYGGP